MIGFNDDCAVVMIKYRQNPSAFTVIKAAVGRRTKDVDFKKSLLVPLMKRSFVKRRNYLPIRAGFFSHPPENRKEMQEILIVL
jgi:hypothetical protein